MFCSARSLPEVVRARHSASTLNTISASQMSAKPSQRAGGIGSCPTNTPQVSCIAGVR